MSDQLARVAELVERETGIQTKDSQLGALAAALDRVAPGLDPAGFLAALGDPARRQVLLGRLIDEAAIQETYFMREPRELEAVDWHRLLAAAHERGAGEVAVWVAACASGEEAYSVAMLAAEAFGGGRAPVSILATDVSDRALARAGEALYSERSMRDVGDAQRARFFASAGRRSSVGGQLRSMVRLRKHNLVADEAPPEGEGQFDLILCRNVLIYVGAKTVESTVASLEMALRPGGQLILGASDRLTSSAGRLHEIVALPPEKPVGRAPTGSGWRTPPRPRPRLPLLTRPRAASNVRDALEAANGGDYAGAVEKVEGVLAADPLDAEAYFVRGMAELACQDPGSAVGSFRRALYVDPAFGLAAFQLGRAHDVRGDTQAARRAYAQALRGLDGASDRHPDLLAGVDTAELVAACRRRIGAA
jgi:chemotaxis methyl-accepting protein methylase